MTSVVYHRADNSMPTGIESLLSDTAVIVPFATLLIAWISPLCLILSTSVRLSVSSFPYTSDLKMNAYEIPEFFPRWLCFHASTILFSASKLTQFLTP